MRTRLLAAAAATAAALTLGCGTANLPDRGPGQPVEVEDCDHEDWVNREDDCGFTDWDRRKTAKPSPRRTTGPAPLKTTRRR